MTKREIMVRFGERTLQDCAYYIGLTGNLDKIAAGCTEALGTAAEELEIPLDALVPHQRSSYTSLRSLLTEILRNMQRGSRRCTCRALICRLPG